jgi:hypothetical protein
VVTFQPMITLHSIKHKHLNKLNVKTKEQNDLLSKGSPVASFDLSIELVMHAQLITAKIAHRLVKVMQVTRRVHVVKEPHGGALET